MVKTQTVILDDNGGFAAKYDGTCVVSGEDGSVWRLNVSATGELSATKLAEGS